MNEKCLESLGQNITQFAKADNGKLRISLVPTQIVRDVAEVRMYGDRKYHAPNNWVLVEMDRYVDALMRHLLAFIDDPNSVDEESGIPHYKHAACNMAFICAMMGDDWASLDIIWSCLILNFKLRSKNIISKLHN